MCNIAGTGFVDIALVLFFLAAATALLVPAAPASLLLRQLYLLRS